MPSAMRLALRRMSSSPAHSCLMQDWYAPSLHARAEAGVQHWPKEQVVALLKNGVTTNASVLGPMAEVVSKSTQHWSEAD
ncbi:MAG: hypothetical protein HC765_14595, partial [Brachymonas sp.]|nr:hypothetical protein [Brachymonas sp.]